MIIEPDSGLEPPRMPTMPNLFRQKCKYKLLLIFVYIVLFSPVNVSHAIQYTTHNRFTYLSYM